MSAKQEAQAAANQANQVGIQQGQAANAAEAALTPFATREMNAQHLFTPGQEGEMLTTALGSSGAAVGDEAAKLKQQATLTHNATGVTKSLDEMARDRAKAAAGAGENIASQDVMGAKQLNQEGAGLMSNLFQTNTNAQLKAMGIQTGDIQAQTAAGGGGIGQSIGMGINDAATLAKLYPSQSQP